MLKLNLTSIEIIRNRINIYECVPDQVNENEMKRMGDLSKLICMKAHFALHHRQTYGHRTERKKENEKKMATPNDFDCDILAISMTYCMMIRVFFNVHYIKTYIFFSCLFTKCSTILRFVAIYTIITICTETATSANR